MNVKHSAIALFSAISLSAANGATLEEEFRSPPDSARPWVYWINMDGHLTREGITADFEAMKRARIGGMIYMDVDVGVPRGKVPFMGRQWQENVKHAVLECERLGLEFTTITGPGWTGSGGPWIKVEQSMQHLVPSSVNTEGPRKFNEILPKPQPRVSVYHRNQTPQMRKALDALYEDVAVYAFPRRDEVIADISEKALFHRQPYSSAAGLVDFTHAGEDFGNQRGPMIGLNVFEKHFAPKYGKYFEMVHSHGARTMLHMCGCCEAFLPRLIELGLDVYDVVQPTTAEMEIASLQERFGDRLTFCGTVCVQSTPAWGTVQDVEREVRRRLELFPDGGLFLGPTHAVQFGSPLENTLTMYRTAGSLCEEIDDSILSIRGGENEVDKIDLAKLF